jgi:chaperonin GroES
MKLETLLSSPNIAEEMDAGELSSLGFKLMDEINLDLTSRLDWEDRNEKANKLALQVVEKKTFPWPGASNVKFPLITIAAMQYHSRAYPSLVSNNEVVKCKVYGSDPTNDLHKQAQRISTHMTYQVMEEDEGWEENTDRTLLVQAIAGTAIKKSYFDSVKGHNVSELVLPNDFIVNYYTKSIVDSPRVSQRIFLSSNDLHERQARGIFCIPDTEVRPTQVSSNLLNQAKQQAQGVYQQTDDPDTPYEFFEMHCWMDLDEDGYKEPYTVFIRRDTEKIYRIVARYFESSIERASNGKIIRINPEQYFTKYGFIPSPDGGFYDLGFGTLLGPLNDSINTIVNQLIDAGTMSNTGGGFLGRGVKIKGGDYTFKPMEWKRVDSTGDDLRANIFPLPVREPSAVLFQLLNLLISYGERIAGATDIMTGVSPGQNTPAETSRNTVEQGMKVFNGIYKRTWRAMKEEFQKLYRLNQLYLPPESLQFEYNNEMQFISPDDYILDMKLIKPAADPNVVSDSQRVMQAQAVAQLAASSGGFNTYEVNKRYLEALKVPGIDQVLPDPTGPNAIPPQPNYKFEVEKMKNEERTVNHQLKFKLGLAKLMSEAELQQAKVTELQAKSVKLLEEADEMKNGHAIAMLQTEIGAKKANMDGIMRSIELMRDLEKDTANTTKGIGNESSGISGLEATPNNS